MKKKSKFGILLLMLCLMIGFGTVSAKAATASQSLVNGGKWVTVAGGKKYRLSNGKYAKYTWAKIGGKYYFFLKSGLMGKNRMLTLSGKTYYLKSTGVRAQNEWVTRSGKKYYFDSNGVRAKSKWIKWNGKYYYVNSKGVMLKNQWIGKTYYVGSDGARLTNTVKGGYYLDSSGKRGIKVFNGKYIFVGDSRTVGMKAAVSRSDTRYIAKSGMGLQWLKSTASVTLDQYLKTNPNVTVILALGVNDLGNIEGYKSYYKQLIKKYPNTKFYIMSVNPVNDKTRAKKGYATLTSTIVSFNKKMYVAFPNRYINTYRYLYNETTKKYNFKSSDGLHYSAKDYKNIYKWTIDRIKSMS